MKKVLIATTALVLTAGMAAAEVKLSGDARMGVKYDGENWNFSSRARVAFTLSGTTDGGLEFGAKFQADDADSEAGAPGAENGTSGTVFISGAFGKIAMGDVTSASEELFGDLASVGYLGDSQGSVGGLTNEIPYLTLDNNTQSALLYTYSAGAFSVAASVSDGQKDGTFDNIATPLVDESEEAQSYALAAAYTFGNYTVGLGYEVLDPVLTEKLTQTELAGIAKFGNTDVKAYYAIGGDENPVDDAFGIGAASVFGAVTVSGYVQKVSFVAVAADSVTWYGLGAAYDLGGGATLAGGIQDNDIDNTDPTANFGVKFKF